MDLSKSDRFEGLCEVHVLTDRSEEIDDEMCIKYLRELKDVPLKLLFIFTGTESITSQEAIDTWYSKGFELFFSAAFCILSPCSSVPVKKKTL